MAEPENTNPAAWRDRLDPAQAILLTGAAGFIGFHLAERLLQAGLRVAGLDNMNAYYDPSLKDARLDRLQQYAGFTFTRADLADRQAIADWVGDHQPAHIVHLAAQAGVRYSIENPHAYADSNLTGFLNMLEASRAADVQHLVYASSSSVYGGNISKPFRTTDPVDTPVSLYAATKKANELMAHAYAHLYGIPMTGLRFFTVYGPWGRPDMAYFLFTKAILAGKPIKVFNHGDMARDFTYIDDIVEGVCRVIPRAPGPAGIRDSTVPVPHKVYNIGNDRPERLGDLIGHLEDLLGKPALRDNQPMPPGDVQETWAEMSDLRTDTGFHPETPLREGLDRFVEWYKAFYRP